MTADDRWITRREGPDDVAAVRDVNLAAFDTADEADLVDALRNDSAWIPRLSQVATSADGAVVGYALMTRCHIGGQPALCLAPCAVRPEHQRSGAGGAVIRAVLDEARDLGEEFVVVLGHPDYYPRFGFERASRYGISLSVEVPDEALRVLSLAPGHEPPAGVVQYAAPFGI